MDDGPVTAKNSSRLPACRPGSSIDSLFGRILPFCLAIQLRHPSFELGKMASSPGMETQLQRGQIVISPDMLVCWPE